MYVGTPLRTLAAASLTALVMVTAPAGLAHATSPRDVMKAGCEAAGYLWSDTKGCANRHCPDGGKPGDTRVVRTTGGQDVGTYMCNGFTGEWENIDIRPQQNVRPTIRRTGSLASP
jgi:hypothetical protein